MCTRERERAREKVRLPVSARTPEKNNNNRINNSVQVSRQNSLSFAINEQIISYQCHCADVNETRATREKKSFSRYGYMRVANQTPVSVKNKLQSRIVPKIVCERK